MASGAPLSGGGRSADRPPGRPGEGFPTDLDVGLVSSSRPLLFPRFPATSTALPAMICCPGRNPTVHVPLTSAPIRGNTTARLHVGAGCVPGGGHRWKITYLLIWIDVRLQEARCFPCTAGEKPSVKTAGFSHMGRLIFPGPVLTKDGECAPQVAPAVWWIPLPQSHRSYAPAPCFRKTESQGADPGPGWPRRSGCFLPARLCSLALQKKPVCWFPDTNLVFKVGFVHFTLAASRQ